MKSLYFCLLLLILLSSCKEDKLPTVTTGNISSITQTSALCKGYLFSQGSCGVISKGICWNTMGDPTIYNDTITVDSSTTFTIKLTDLKINTKYYVRAFAINCLGTSYGETKSFSTDPPYIPKVETYLGPLSNTTTTSVFSGGVVISDGKAEIIDRGICWSKSQNPDSSELANNKVSARSGLGSYFVTITGLMPNTDYFVRAYATNIAGTGYGEPLLATTKFAPDPNLPVDSNYPTTFYKLDPGTLSKRITAFADRNKYIVSSLNEFGFCSGGGLYSKPPQCNNITREEAVEIVKNFISQNQVETGITDPNNLTIIKTINTTTYNNDFRWYLESSPQKIGSIEVFGAITYINIINSEVVIFNGNWYPNIYIPLTFNLDQEMAKNLLVGRITGDTDIGGYPYYMIITSESLNLASAKLVIFPLNTGDSIQLRITWEISVMSHKIYVDVMTGEIVYDMSMIIS
jgi:hypothetical protein